MIPIKHSSIFKSRWMALLWAAGICWFGMDVAQSAHRDDADGNEVAASNQASGDSFSAADVKAFEQNIASLK